jgi:hypothetical protein
LRSFAVRLERVQQRPRDAGAGAGGDADLPVECEEGSFPGTATEPIAIGSVTGQIVDEQGEPTSAGLVQVCGKDICINARVGDNGRLAEDVMQDMDAPACKIGDGLTWAKLALSLSEGDSELGILTTARLPSFAEGTPLTASSTISSGGVTLELPPRACISIDTLTYETEAEQTFRAVSLPEPALAQLSADFVAGFALSPVDTQIFPRPAVSLENTAALPAGTELRLFMQGLDVAEEFAPYAGWQELGEGVVSEDGKTLDFAEGPPVLTVLGVKVKD